jgi:hypothetical protein
LEDNFPPFGVELSSNDVINIRGAGEFDLTFLDFAELEAEAFLFRLLFLLVGD